MTNKVPDNLTPIQQLVVAAETIFNKLFPGTKEKYNKEMVNTVNKAPEALPPMPTVDIETETVDEKDEKAAAMKETHAEFKIEKSAPVASPSLPGFVEVGNVQKSPENKNRPLNIADIQRIRNAHRGVISESPTETQNVPNPNSNNANVLSA